jgi:hypothetical protein
LKGSLKDAFKDAYLITPWNLLAVACVFALTKWLCGLVGPSGYGTTLGNFTFAEIMLLSAYVAGVFMTIGRRIFRVPDSQEQTAFWLPGMVSLAGVAGSCSFFLRAFGILFSIIDPGPAPPPYLAWLFSDDFLAGLLRFGA